MTTSLVLWGASGHAKVLNEFLPGCGYRLTALFDNDPAVASPFPGVPLFRGVDGFLRWLERAEAGHAFLVAIGGQRGRDRIRLHRLMAAKGLLPAIARHPASFIAGDAVVGDGSQILAHASVCAGARMGLGCIANTGAIVDHESVLGDGVHIAPGATVAGCVSIGDGTMIGVGATVLPRIRIGRDVVVGAGAVVTKDLPDGVVAYGVPAAIVRQNPSAHPTEAMP